MKKIVLTRDSVAMGDDIEAPHRLEVEIDEAWNITQILDYIRSIRYLPSIIGGKATWSVAIDKPIAILKPGISTPALFCMPDYPYQNTRGFVDIQHIHFNYHAQQNPELVYEVLRCFKTKP